MASKPASRERAIGQRNFGGGAGHPKPTPVSANDGEWRIMIEKTLALGEKALGKNTRTAADSILSTIENILREPSHFRDVG